MTSGTVATLPLFGLADQADRLRSAALAVYTLDCSQASVATAESLERVLDADELEGLRRLRQPEQRRQATVARGALRWLLGAYLQISPQAVPLYRESGGRPRLRAGATRMGLSLSCASNAGQAVIAVAAGAHEVGVDVERVCSRRFGDALAASMLHARERVLFEDLPHERRAAWLAGAWVRKEATLKALGLGLGIDPRETEVMMPSDHDQGRFRPTGFAHFDGWSVRHGETVIAMVCARDGLLPRWARLVM